MYPYDKLSEYFVMYTIYLSLRNFNFKFDKKKKKKQYVKYSVNACVKTRVFVYNF